MHHNLQYCAPLTTIQWITPQIIKTYTAKPHGTRPYRTRTSMGHGFEVGPKFFEIHGFTRFCGFLTRESKKSNVVLMGNTQFFMSNLSWQLFCEAWFLRNTLFFMSNLLWSLISKKGMVFLVEFAMPNLLWSLISKKYTVFHVKFVMTTFLWSLISKKYTVFHVKFALKFDF